MYDLIATATFGLEAVVRREIEQLGYKVTRTEDGKVTFLGDIRAIVRANLWLRAADRVLIKMAEFQASESEELFQQVKGIAWEELTALPPRISHTKGSAHWRVLSGSWVNRSTREAS
jgi:putative N6-adenine-specific DNA methylase